MAAARERSGVSDLRRAVAAGFLGFVGRRWLERSDDGGFCGGTSGGEAAAATRSRRDPL
jgi:hypothetical protein